ncbi:MAG: hypothetical protein JO154_08725 [Chitinophaga sp.]|uniref:hypothetical protein n=1 Tax=Chitinophaga sp. TaxID=1869181 RepID=UPI0025C301F6|nr:hypothetical protein [Chitinophaga sp.]MBV8252678.1 hypothetical protein [Chitinophaga sp.]
MTLVGSMLPIILRFVTSLDLDIGRYDIKDFLFAGLAINLNNFNLITSEKVEAKIIFSTISAFAIVVLAFLLGVFIGTEVVKPAPAFIWLSFIAVICFLGSAYLSYEANKIIYKS